LQESSDHQCRRARRLRFVVSAAQLDEPVRDQAQITPRLSQQA